MDTRMQALTQVPPTPFLTPVPRGILQRKCVCGTHTVAGGECAGCAKNKSGLQRKLAIGASNDPLEQEADRIADQVMATPAHHAVSGAPPRIQRYSGQTNGEMDAAPASVDQALASPGRPLEPALRRDMEQRFGDDFSRVRVHTDAKAAEAAHAIDALAYTVAPDIVFGAGQYAPHTTAGRTLLAHELTHIIQREAGDVIRRRPTAEEIKARKRDAWLKELAADPDLAHRVWKRLTTLERGAVVVQMTKRYGDDFAKSFLQFTEHPSKSGYAISNSPEHTPEWFQARGYRLMQTSLGAGVGQTMEYWVHPSGYEIWQIVDKKRDVPPTVDCKELTDVTLAILYDSISTETTEQRNLEGEKDQLEKMDKTTDDYCTRYAKYKQSLRAMKTRIDTSLEDINTLRQQLVEMNCPVDVMDAELPGLTDLQIWADIESSSMMTQFLECIKVPPLIRLPEDEE